MNRNIKAVTAVYDRNWLVNLFILTFLIFALSAPLALAGQTQDPIANERSQQPAVPATPAAEPEQAMTRTLDSYAGSRSATSGNSVDFMMGTSPLSAATAPAAAPTVTVPEPPPVRHAPPAPVTLQVLRGKVLEEPEEVAILVSEKCSQNGGAANGTNSCERVYSNGHHATVLTQNADEGDELKHQTVIEEFDGDNVLLFRKTIRHRVDYNYLNDKKAKEKEFFDIVYQPAGKKATRELMVYEYFMDTGKTRSLSWTQYKQIGNKPKAELVYHALLRYGDDGSPDRALAEEWDHGKRAETFLNWSRNSKGFATFDEESWGQWEGWIQSVSLQAYLP